ncbi:hypothetical protein D3C76_1465620 [compost metagenome]
MAVRAGFAEGHVFLAAGRALARAPLIQAGLAIRAAQGCARHRRESLDQAAGGQVDGVALEQQRDPFTADVLAVQRLDLFSAEVLQFCFEVRQS